MEPENATAEAEEAAEATTNASQLRWEAVLMVEGVPTDDGRMIDAGAIDWRELPLSLMAMTETGPGGHEGAEVAGRIDNVWRDGNRIMGSGVFDSGEHGAEVARLVSEGMLRGVSVDLAIREFEYRPKNDDGTVGEATDDVGEGDILDILFGEVEMVYVVTDGSIGAATVCPFPAFKDAEIALVASAPLTWRSTGQSGMTITEAEAPAPDSPLEGEAGEVVVTASAAGLAPTTPPVEWFEDPELTEPTPLQVTDDGRVFGHAAVWDVCHIGFENDCVLAPRSDTEYAMFLLGEVEVEDDGETKKLPCGTITLGTGHAALRLSKLEAVEHYDDTGTQAAYVAAGEDEFGIWYAGSVAPNLTEERVAELRAAKISGDWRSVDGNLELVAMLAVNVPGFPVPRLRATTASGELPVGEALLSAGVADQRVLDAIRARAEALDEEIANLAAEAVGTDGLIEQARGPEVPATDAPFGGR